jgi:hypothetical protein
MFDEEMFKKIEKEKLKIIVRMFNEMEGKNANDRIQIMFTYGLDMKSKGLYFTREESSLLMDILKTNLSENEKNKIDSIAKMLKNLG